MSGMVAVTIPTRRYWTTATTRSSPPRSRLTATRPDAPPAVSASIPVSGVTPGCRPSSRPAPMLTASVPVVINRTGSQSAARPLSVDGWASTPMTTPITAWAAVVARRGTAAGARPANASAVATTRPAKSAGEGSRSRASATVPAAVPTTSSAHRRPSPVPTSRSSPGRSGGAGETSVTPLRQAGPHRRGRRRHGAQLGAGGGRGEVSQPAVGRHEQPLGRHVRQRPLDAPFDQRHRLHLGRLHVQHTDAEHPVSAVLLDQREVVVALAGELQEELVDRGVEDGGEEEVVVPLPQRAGVAVAVADVQRPRHRHVRH